MTIRHARIYDVFALLTALVVLIADQWTKSLVVAHLGPPNFGPIVPVIGQYLEFYYITNTGAAFSMFDTNGPILILLIIVAVVVIVYLYLRMLNSGPLIYKLVFGLIIGGAAGNLLNRFTIGSVVDFIWFRIPQIGFSFAIFNLADASISIGVILLFISLLGGLGRKPQESIQEQPKTNEPLLPTQAQEHDV